MNPLMKCWCRCFQLAFRLAMPLMPYREPERFESIQSLPPLLERLVIRSILLVTDRPLREAEVTRPLEELLERSGIRCAVYDGTRANPTVRNVEEARERYLAEDCQGLIAFGGGSSMDCAKAVGARIVYPGRSVNQMKGLLRVLRRLPPLIAIPTTAGTGSEVTVTAVITDSDRKHKYTMNNFTMIPRWAVLDPAVTRTLPPALTAATGMDALTHAVEAYIGGSTTRETRRLALQAVRLVFANIEAGTERTWRPEKICFTPPISRASPSPNPTWAISTRWPTPWAASTTRPTDWPTPCCCPSDWSCTGPVSAGSCGSLAGARG